MSMVIAAVYGYLAVGALVALGLHTYAERLATPDPERLCSWCRDERDRMIRVNGPLLAARGPGPWLLMLAITMLIWPVTAPTSLLRRLRHRCSTPHLGGSR
ncbi:hypothetical protein [Nocardiopsis dassonvillei]|uniref:hypothetical protein n=1 Tax=Nocardiopsis dassonvillei TaxID=2014 RepID=UPI003639CB8C